MILRAALVLAALYALVCLAVWLGQSRFLYFPDDPAAGVVAARAHRLGLQPWPAGEGDVRALVREPTGAARGTVVVLHGNAGSAVDRAYYLEPLARRGWRVVLAEYPGYGGRPGAPREVALVADAAETVRRARDAWGTPIVVWGESLGAGVAGGAVGELTTAGVPVAGVVLLTPWDTLPNLAQAVYPLLPARWLCRDRYDTAANLAEYGGRVAVVRAERDEIIPARLTEALVRSLRPESRTWVLAGAGHNDWPTGPDEALWDEVLDWVTAPGP